MPTPRRFVERIEPNQAQSFDQHFWPVLVALCVLCGIAFGAALTLLRGPWMWGSLLILPAAAAISIYFLYQLDDTKLRRSLQLAIIVSLAGHLLVLIFASVTFIFGNDFQLPKQQIVKRPTKTIQISNQRTPQVWEKSNQQDVPEPEVKIEKEQPTVVEKPQPVPVKEFKPKPQPQVVKRKTPSNTVPKMGQELSQLRRQSRNLMPKSSVQAKPQPMTKRQPTKTAKAEKTISVAKSAASSKTAKATKQPTPKTETAAAKPTTVAKRNRQVQPETNARRLEPTTRSTARIRRSAPQIPMTKPNKSLPEVASKPTNAKASEVSPAKSANTITRRPEQRSVTRPTKQSQPNDQRSTRTQVAQAAERRTQSLSPTISSANSNVKRPRRSTINAPSPTSPTFAEAPTRAPDSNKQSRELNAKTLSVSKGESGVAGAGVSRNLDRDLGGAPSPAIRASDSASRRKTQSQTSQAQMLTSSQASDARRSIAEARTPSSAFKANTQLSAKISGARNPSKQSMEASAASVDSSSSEFRAEVTAQKGESSVDFGPTKVVAGQTARRRSGGGQPDVARLNPESTRRSSSRSNERAPTLATNAIAPAMAPNTRDSMAPAADELQPNADAVAHSRSGGDSAITKERSSSEEAGEPLDRGSSRLVEQLADSRERAEKSQQLDSGQFDEEEDEEQKGNITGKLAQAPTLRQEVTEFGNMRSDGGVRETDSSLDGEAIASTIIERAAGQLAGSLSTGAARQLLGAAAVMPLTDSGSANTKSAERANRSSDASAAESLADSTTGSSARSRQNAPTLAPSGMSFDVAQTGESKTEVNLEATDLGTDRFVESDAPGAALDVMAEEGPAGLAENLTRDLGLPTRPASRDSQQIALETPTRFRSEKFGATPSISPDATLAKEAFMNRSPRNSSQGAPSNERAINLGLEFLARNQSADGSWALTGFDRDHPMYRNQLDCDTAATGLALLAFQGAGYNHREFKYASQMNHAIDWLIENQSDKGSLFVETGTKSDASCRLYAHGIAALALSEAYGMTQDPKLREPAQRALDFISDTQDPKRGGWRYYTRMSARQTDTSVTGWMMMALQSGRLAGLQVNGETLNGISQWLKVAEDSQKPSEFRYNPFATDSANIRRTQGRTATPPMTAVGLLMQIYNGWDRNDPRLLRGAQALVDQQLPSDANTQLRDTYYWYYATQVLLHVDGPLWKTWESNLHPLLVKSQVQDGDLAGSWNPYAPVPDRWGVHAGRLYVTTMNLLSLEVKNRKLPLYDDTLVGEVVPDVDPPKSLQQGR